MKYIIALNKYNESKSYNQSDFFKTNELNEIETMIAELTNYDISVIDDELNFIAELSHNNSGHLKVLNLTRQGSFNNKKILVHAYCDIRSIPCISSSAFSVNACRNKGIMRRISSISERFPKCFNMTDIPILMKKEKKLIIKSKQGAGSIGMDLSSLGYIEENKGSYYLNNQELSESFFKLNVLQEFVEGQEIEVPFIVINGTVKILGYYELKYPDEILTESLSDSFCYGVQKISGLDEDFVTNTIQSIKEDFYIDYYGRVDFRVADFEDTSTYKVFDIATTPYFINNTSFAKAFKNSKYSNEYINVLELILSLNK